MSPPRKPLAHLVMGLVGVVAALALVLTVVPMATRFAGLEPGESPIERLSKIERKLDGLGRGRSEAGPVRIAYMGDSTVEGPFDYNLPMRLKGALVEQYKRQIRRQGRPLFQVKDIALPAMSNITYHFLAREIVARQPDLILWQTSFVHTSAFWRMSYTHHEFAGLMSIGDVFRLSWLPIQDLGLSMDDVLLYKLLLAADFRDLWIWLEREQSRVEKAPRALENWMFTRLGLKTGSPLLKANFINFPLQNIYLVDGRRRYRKQAAIDRLGAGASGLSRDHVSLGILDQSLKIFADAEIPVVLYLNPVNLDHLARIGVLDQKILQQGVEQYAAVALANGAHFVDLHDLLPDAGFSDERGHFQIDDTIDSPGLVIDALVPAVVEQLNRIFSERKQARRAGRASPTAEPWERE